MSTCDFCQKNKTSNQKPAGLLQPLAIPEFRWASVSVGFITQLPETAAGHSAIVVFVDTKMSLTKIWENSWAANVFQQGARCTILLSLLSMDCCKRLSVTEVHSLPKFYREVSKLLGVKQCGSSSHHPQSDGQTERANRTLEDMLRFTVSGFFIMIIAV